MSSEREVDLRIPWRRHLPMALVISGLVALSFALLPVFVRRPVDDPNFPDKLYSVTLRDPSAVTPRATPPATEAPR